MLDMKLVLDRAQQVLGQVLAKGFDPSQWTERVPGVFSSNLSEEDVTLLRIDGDMDEDALNRRIYESGNMLYVVDGQLRCGQEVVQKNGALILDPVRRPPMKPVDHVPQTTILVWNVDVGELVH